MTMRNLRRKKEEGREEEEGMIGITFGDTVQIPIGARCDWLTICNVLYRVAQITRLLSNYA